MTDRENTIELLRLGYDEPTRSLNFRVGFFNDWEAVFECLFIIDTYNAFDAEEIVKALRPFTALFMRLEIGRESSPVMYFSDWANTGELEAIGKALSDVGADEVDIDESGTLRVWWD